MPEALDTNTFSPLPQLRGMWIYNSSDTARDDHRNSPLEDSTSSSSIGNNSDASGGGCDSDDDGGAEVQSLFKGSLNNLSDLEQALALKRGISSFYSGKSKSYTSLADAVSVPSIQHIVKPEDAYNRKRKNMIAHSVILNKNRNSSAKSGIPLAGDSDNHHHHHHHSNAGGESSSSPGGSTRPPLPGRHKISPPLAIHESSPRNYCSPWRSLSLSDLQHAAGAASGFTANKRDDDD